MAEPRIYSRNWVDAQCTFSSTHGGNFSYLYDRGTTSVFSTTGANNDLTLAYFYVYFFEGGVPQWRVIDGFIAQNYNFKYWVIDQWDGSVWVNVFANYSDDLSNRYIPVTQFGTSALRVGISVTKTANQDKTIGEFIACGLTYTPRDLSSYDTKWRERSKEIVLGDGSIHRVNVRNISGRLGKYEARCRWTYLSKAERDSLKAIKEAGQPFLWQPESVNVPEEVYYVHWTNAWDDKYMSNYKGAGYEVVMDVKEV